MLKVAAGVILCKGKVLIAQRRETDRLAYKWEFPGGKIERAETPEDCLVREIKEELGMDIKVTEYCASSKFHNGLDNIELMAFYAEVIGGELRLYVHNDAKWVDLGQLGSYDFAAADWPIVEKIINHPH